MGVYSMCENVPHGSLGNLYARPLQIFSQSHVKLVQPTKLQIRHRLLLVLDIAASADLVGGRHDCWWRSSDGGGDGVCGDSVVIKDGRAEEAYATAARAKGTIAEGRKRSELQRARGKNTVGQSTTATS